MLKLQHQRQPSSGPSPSVGAPVPALISQLAPQPRVLAEGNLQAVVKSQLNIPECNFFHSFLFLAGAHFRTSGVSG